MHPSFGVELQAQLGGRLMSIAAASWVLHVPAWRPSAPEAFKEAWAERPAARREITVFGRKCHENRYSRALGRSYSYAGQVAAAAPIEDGSVAAGHLAACVDALGPAAPALDGCLANWYEPEHSIAAHRDNENTLVTGAPIASVSWGATRRFLLKPHAADGPPAGAQKLELLLGDGDLLIMGGELQRTHTHEIPKPRKKDASDPGRRISWTFRAFRPTDSDPPKKRRRVGGAQT